MKIFDVKKETWTGVNVGFVVERKVFVPRCPLIFWRKFLRKYLLYIISSHYYILHFEGKSQESLCCYLPLAGLTPYP